MMPQIPQPEIEKFITALISTEESIDKLTAKIKVDPKSKVAAKNDSAIEKLDLTEESKKKAKKSPEKKEVKLIKLNPAGTASHHDAWLFYKPEATIFYMAMAHHIDLFYGLAKIGREDIVNTAMSTKKDITDIRFGDVKHGIPRTIKENQIQKEPLRTLLINAFYSSRK